MMPKEFILIISSVMAAVATEGDSYRLSAWFNAEKYATVVKKHQLELKHNTTTRAVSLMSDKVDSKEEGQYEMEENFNKANGERKDGAWIFRSNGLKESFIKSNGDTYARKDGAWIFRLNVLEPDEIKRGNVGENLTILRLNTSTTSIPRLYYYDQLVTVLIGDRCDISTESRFYGRLRCKNDNVENTYRIEMQNVAQMDTGLYRVNTDGHDTEQCFLNITDQAALVKGTTVTSRLNNVAIHYSSDGIYYSHLSTESLPSTAKPISSDNTGIPCSVSVPVYIIPIIVGAVGVINLTICCLIWIKRKNGYSLEAERRHALEECDTDLYLTPVTAERPLTIPPSEDGRTSHFVNAQNMQFESSIHLFHRTQSLSINVYEIIDDSSSDDPENFSHDEKLVYESTETVNAPLHDTSGYLTVLG